ncbi:MAG: Acetylornithine deacetylase/Succinyl-diaminopimelate desuccinylase [Myxococcales bacterium]|nr:Acetylornithine deacetylase/Succinyl-diaminopimelate desuccinylase [Myxococcales bacterium]
MPEPMGKHQDTHDRALAALRKRGDEMIALTRTWVEINSYTANVEGVNRVGALLREAFSLPSLTCKTIPGGPEHGDHLIWRTSASGAPIVLVGHHDTVFPPGHFEGWREEGRRAVGPGALDMKGGLSIIRATLAALDEVGALADLPIVVVSVADEEIGSPSSTPHLIEAARGAACALVFESGRAADAIITRRKGVGAMTVVAHGKAAHAGNNHKDGANAIWALAKFVDAAQQLTDYTRGRTVNVGQFSGGTSKNTVPERAECMLDLRYETVADAEELVASIRAAAETAAIAGVRMEVTGGARRLPLERTTASAALREEYAACARSVGLGDGEAALLGGGSDANTIGPLGVPVIDGLGPRGAGFHTTTEYVELDTFAPKAEALLRFLLGRGSRS